MAQTPPTPPPNRRGALSFLMWILAGLLIGGGAAFLAANIGLLDELAPLQPLLAIGVAVLALPFFIRWLVHRDEWWAVLTAWVFASMAVLILLLWFSLPYDQFLGMVGLVLMALPFGAVWIVDRRRWWAIIPFYALIALAGLLGLTIFDVSQMTLGSFALLAAALPFWVAYMLNRQRWWPLLPAGALSAIAVIMLTVFTLLQPGGGAFYVVLNAALAGVSIAVWLTIRRFDWAVWMAVGFALAAVLSIWFPSSANWALVALALGIYIAYKQIDAAQRRKVGRGAQPPPSQQPSQPSAPPPPAPPAAQPPKQQPAPGARADREATAGHEARQEAGNGGGRPAVEFRPIDPFKNRRDQEEKENGDDK